MSDSYIFGAPLSVRCAEVIVVDCERGFGDLRALVRQVYWKDGTLLAEHDWLHDDPIFANFFLRSAAERGEWLPVKLRDQADVPPETSQDQAPVFAGVDVQQDRVSMRTDHPIQPESRLEMTLTDHGWRVVASHPRGASFFCICDDAKIVQHIGAWLAELRAEVALARNKTQEEQAARLAAVTAGQGA